MTAPRFTKSDFLAWRDCPKSFWLEQREPDTFRRPPPSPFVRMLMEDGFAVEAEAKTLVAAWPDADRCRFQQIFDAEQGLHARADLVRDLGERAIDIFEIKASTSLRASDGSDHVLDACFQHIVARRAGFTVRGTYIIHVDKDYVRRGAIDPAALLVIRDISEEVAARRADVEAEIDDALAWLARADIDENRCECRYKTNAANRCAAFARLNPDVPEQSAHLLPRISAQKLKALDAEGRLALDRVTADDLTKLQRPVWQAGVSGEAVIDRAEIDRFLAGLAWPLWFYDYETYGSAVPAADSHSPHQQLPVQVSVHRLGADGTLEQFEYLCEAHGDQEGLVARLREFIGPQGSLLAWNMSTEKSLNQRMAKLLPRHEDFLADLSSRTLDLMDVFKLGWVEPGFRGSVSIKKVLPVLVPDLAYPEDDVHEGTGAMLAWREMVETRDPDRKAELRRQLLHYCGLDTLAMVRIFARLRE